MLSFARISDCDITERNWNALGTRTPKASGLVHSSTVSVRLGRILSNTIVSWLTLGILRICGLHHLSLSLSLGLSLSVCACLRLRLYLRRGMRRVHGLHRLHVLGGLLLHLTLERVVIHRRCHRSRSRGVANVIHVRGSAREIWMSQRFCGGNSLGWVKLKEPFKEVTRYAE